MTRTIFRYILHFFILTVIQQFVLDNLFLFNLIHPYIYFAFILMLPVNTNRYVYISIALVYGFIIDILSFTYGLHTSTLVVIGFLRPYMMRLFVSEEQMEQNVEVHFTTIGARRYLIYLLIMLFIHHSLLNILQVFSFREYFFTLYKTVLNILASMLIIVVYDLTFFVKAKTN
jgi:rod shape-determining protein MreD